MFLITLVEKGGARAVADLRKAEVTIGRLAGNDIVLGKGNVSKYHSRFVLKDGKYIVVDMQSTNGPSSTARRSPRRRCQADRQDLHRRLHPQRRGAAGRRASEDEQEYARTVKARPRRGEPAAEEEYAEGDGEEEQAEEEYEEEEPEEETRAPEKQQRMPASMANALSKRKSKVDPAVEAYARLQKDIHDRLIEYLDLRRLDMDRLGDEELWRRTRRRFATSSIRWTPTESCRRRSIARAC